MSGIKIFSLDKLHELFKARAEAEKVKKDQCEDCVKEATREAAYKIRGKQ